ncbi:MAG TPA: flagellar biosynthesis protein FlaG [Eubacterium sp.]|nr:flagellar biosynthesis protein FlaG [Eubacterium sp.]
MGIEVNGVAAASSYQSQTSQVAKPVSQVGGASTATDKGNEVVADTAKSAVSSAAVAVGQASESEKNGNNDAQKEQQKQASSMADVKDIRKVLNNNTIAEFGYNEPTNRITIKIKDKDTNEVIKEIPSEKALEMLAKAWELAGIMVDERR